LQKNFDAALAHVLLFEGAYSDHPLDPGGATNLGITQAELQIYRGQPVSKDDVRALTQKEAASIYEKNYWQAARCGSLPSGIDFAVFDCAVNQGVGRAARFLQQAANVAVDGQIGPATLAAIAQAPAQALLAEFMARRMLSYGLLQKLFKTFGLGWSRRLMATHIAAQTLLSAAPAKADQPSNI
jgi:lysozyme family protein